MSGRGSRVALSGVELRRALLLSGEAGRTVQVVLDGEGGFEVLGREGGDGSAWEVHAAGRWGTSDRRGESVEVAALREGLAPVALEDFYRETAAGGIAYGPSFRALTGLWSGGGEALGEVTLPAALVREGPAAQPVLLDGCIQVLGGVSGLAGEDGVWLPFGWEELWLSGALPERVFCRARFRDEVGAGGEGEWGDVRKADLDLYGPGGEALGGVSGFLLKRADRAALLGLGVDELFYEVEWRRGPEVGPGSAAFLAGPAAVASGCGAGAAAAEADGSDRREDAGLERESRWFALRGLEELGWERRVGERFEVEELRRRLKVTGDHRELFARLLGLLEEAGVVRRDAGGDVLVAVDGGDPLPEGVAAPEGAAGSVEREVLRRCGSSLAEVLRGRSDPLELLFAEAPGAAALYAESRTFGVANRLAGAAVAAAVRDLPGGRRLRVLEVGAGTGATTAAVLSALPADRTDYEFTDVSAGFFAAAERRFGDAGADLRFRALDIERDPREQGFRAHGYDVVVAGHALEATRDLGAALAHCRGLLAPSGLLVAVEGTAGAGWLDLTFGLLPGWWRFEDDYRGDSPLAPVPVWRRVLSDAGYGEVSVLDAGRGQAVLLARGPGEVAPGAGLFVLSGGGAFGSEAARELSLRGQQVVSGPPGGDREAWRRFFESLPGEVPLRGVVHLEGVRGDGSEALSAELRTELEAVGSGALSLVQGLSDAGVRPADGVWLATRGGQVVSRERTGALAGAALWGFGSVVGLEHGDLGPRLLDLDPASAASAGTVAEEVLYPDRETRVAWRDGERRVPRLVRRAGVGAVGDGLPGASGRVRGDRSYLVTGGLGGLGLEVAGWLAGAGAGAVVLNGRRAPGARAEGVVSELRGRGVEVRVELADVTDGDAVEALLRRLEAEGPPLGGVVHSVGVLSDGALTNQDWGRFEEVLWPKVLGAWHLHRATEDRDLDLFVLFSSVVGVLGNAGQANYAAANAFLDQLARHRRARGLAGQAIAWGAWSGVGQAEAARERISGKPGVLDEGWIPTERGRRALARVVAEDVGASVVASVDWSRLPSPAAWLEELAGPAADREEVGVPLDVADRVRGLPEAEREGELLRFLEGELASVLRLRSAPPAETGFFELGMDSLMAVELRSRVNRALGGEVVLSNTAVFDHPSAARLARHLAGVLGGAPPDRRAAAASVVRRADDRVAIVGMACRFPGGPDPEAFWRRLEAGEDLVTRGRPDGLYVDGETEAERPYGAYVEGMDRFDAGFFRISPVEAELLDPQQRLLLEASWSALEDAGRDPGGLGGSRTGVYVGIMNDDYRELTAGVADDPSRRLYQTSGATFSTAAGRVSFALGLMGPAVALDTACSSSLVALHQAAGALRAGEADLALAGGVNAILLSGTTRRFREAGMLASDGRCKTYDAAADGYGRGEGCGMFVLKRLSEAEADGDRILGVLLGSAVNQDGASAGLTVPNGPAQERVIGEALSRAGLEPWEVDYLEAHGTGTELGDPVEVRAAGSAYGAGRDAERPLLVGSVKTNVGHLESAAGAAGVVKVLLSMRHGLIPPHLHFETPSPRIEWEALPVRVVSEATAWPAGDRPRRAAVSSFGYSGTNAHVILEAYAEERRPVSRWGPSDRHRPAEADETPHAPRTHRVLPLSGKSSAALRELAAKYLGFLTPESPLADVAWTAGVGRSHFAYRAGVVFGDLESLRKQLESLAAGEDRDVSGGGKVAFLYPGEGSQWAGMGRDLYECEPAFREVLDRCEAAFRDERGGSLLPVMFGDEEGLDRPEWAQPALYALGSGLTALWASVGVHPDAVFGHGAGELAAAGAAGVFTLEDGLRFAARRGALLGSLPAGGAMAAVYAPLETVESELRKTNARVRGPELSLAAENGAHCVVSGPRRLVSSLHRRLGKRGVRVEGLRTAYAFHGSPLDPVLDSLEAAATEFSASAPSVPLVSDVSGRVLEVAPEGAYWRRQAREAVRFGAALGTLAELGVGVVTEIGPRAVLGPLASLTWPEGESPAVVSSLAGEGSGAFASAVGAAYEAGVRIAFEGLFAGEERRRVSLPTYPFQRERYWVKARRRRLAGGHPLLGFRRDARDGQVSFETELGAEVPSWLGDHRVFGEVVAPGALYAAQVAEAVSEAGSRSGVALSEVQLHDPLVLSGEALRTVQVVVSGDGGFEVLSRDGGDGAAWAVHAEGRWGTSDGKGESVDLAALREGLAPVAVEAFYRETAAGGIAYGPAFRVLRGLWSGEGEALGEVALPAASGGKGLRSPPVLLDGCIQVLGGVFGLAGEDGAWLPFGWEELWLSGALPERVFCRARYRDVVGAEGDGESGEVRQANLDIYGPGGEALGGISGFVLKRADRAALLGLGVDELLYGVEWRTGAALGPLGAEFLGDPGAVAAEARRLEEVDESEGVDRAGVAEEGRELERESRWFALTALEELGWERSAGERFAGEDLRRRLKVTGDRGKLFDRLLVLLGEAGVLEGRGGGNWTVEAGSGEALPAGVCAPSGSSGSVERELLRRCGMSLAEVLRGRADPLALLFGEEPGAAEVYGESPEFRAVNRLVGKAVGAAASALPAGRRLRILEVGAGTGATTDAVLGALPAGRTEYDYTDVSAGFFAAAERRFGGSGAELRYRALDIERDPGKQGFGTQGYDVVLAANVLHATRDLGETLRHCRRLLAPSGLLVLVEGTERRGWLDLTFGLLPGWWRFSDRYRSEHALAGTEVWGLALSNAGFEETAFVPSLGGQTVMVARGPSELELERGLFVLSGGGDCGKALEEMLKERGQAVLQGPGGGDREAWRTFFGSLPGELPLRGVVELSGVWGAGWGGER